MVEESWWLFGLAADYGGQFCMAAAVWRGTSSGTTMLARGGKFVTLA